MEESCSDLPVLWCVSSEQTCESLTKHSPPHHPVLLLLLLLLLLLRYMFDEPSSYLDVKQRLKAAVAIRDLLTNDR